MLLENPRFMDFNGEFDCGGREDIFLPCADWSVYNIRQLLSVIDRTDGRTILITRRNGNLQS